MSNAKKKVNSASKSPKNLLITIAIIALAVIIVGLAIYNEISKTGVVLRNSVAAESENYEVDGMMMTYFLNNYIQQYSGYFTYFGVDSSKSLKDQAYSETQTWFDFFKDMTIKYTDEVLALCEYAKANGIELTAEDQASIDESMKAIETNAATYGFTANQYLRASFGTGMKTSDVRRCLELTALADLAQTAFNDSVEYTDEDRSAYYLANKASFDGIDYLKFTVSADDFTVYGEDGEATSEASDDIAAAKTEADKFAAAVNADEFKSLIVAYLDAHHEEHEDHEEGENEATAEAALTRHALASSLEEELSDWAFAAKIGESKIDANDDGDEFTVYYIVKESYRDETVNRNVRHILFTTDTYEDSTKADEVYAELEAANFSDEKWNELCEKWNEDTGSTETNGLYEEMVVGTTLTEFNDWLFDADRRVGDCEVVKTSSGWHIMQYLGEGEKVAWESSADSLKQSDDYTILIEEYSKNIKYNDNVINGIKA